MRVALVLLLCSTVVHVGVSQLFTTAQPHIGTVAPEIQVCDEIDRLPFISSLPNGVQCALGLSTLSNPFTTQDQVDSALANVCNDDCGGIYSKYLEIPCNDQSEAEFLRITCSPTNGSATIGNLCHFALPRGLDSQLLDELSSCDNVSSDNSCTPGCRETLVNLKSQLGCCLQNVYNNTMYDTQRFLDNGFLTQSQFDSLQKLTTPDSNPWTICAVESPERCGAPLFKPPPPPKCTPDDHVAFISSLPNAAVCGSSIGTVLTLPANDSTELANALENVCTSDCGGLYSEFLKSTCNDHFLAETLRIFCVRTFGNAAVGDFCHSALEASLSFIPQFSTQCRDGVCPPSCRAAVLELESQIGCCYQDLLNNTFYYQQQVLNGIITPSNFAEFTTLNGPFTNPWLACNVPVPSKCPEQPPPIGKYNINTLDVI